MVQIKIKDKGFLDLYEGVSVGFVWKNPMLYEEKNSTRSVSIKIPYTENNRAIFACADMVASMGNGIRQIKDAVFYDDAVAVECSLYVTGADDNAMEYAVILCFNTMEQGYDFLKTELVKNHIFAETYTNDWDYYRDNKKDPYYNIYNNIEKKAETGFYDYIELDESNNEIFPYEFNRLYRLPFVGLYDIFTEAMARNGYSLNINKGKDVYLNKIVLKANKIIRPAGNYKLLIKSQVLFDIEEGSVDIYNIDHNTSTIPIHKEIKGTVFKAKQDVSIKVYAPLDSTTASLFGSNFLVIYTSDGKFNRLAQYDTPPDSTNIHIITGDQGEFRLQKDEILMIVSRHYYRKPINNNLNLYVEGNNTVNYASIFGIMENNSSFSVNVTLYEDTDVANGDDFLNKWIIPDWTFIDFIRVFCYLTGSFFYYFDKTIYITGVEELNTNKKPINIEDKLLKRGEVVRTFMDYAQNNFINFDNNEWVEDMWKQEENYDIANPNLTEQKEIYKFPFSVSNGYIKQIAGNNYLVAAEQNYVKDGYLSENFLSADAFFKYKLKSDIKNTLMMLNDSQSVGFLKYSLFYNEWVAQHQSIFDLLYTYIKYDVSFSKMVQASTQIKVTIKMSCFEFFSIKPETIYQYEGVKWIATDINWSKGAAIMTLQKLADF